jgi:hypothetical protein
MKYMRSQSDAAVVDSPLRNAHSRPRRQNWMLPPQRRYSTRQNPVTMCLVSKQITANSQARAEGKAEPILATTGPHEHIQLTPVPVMPGLEFESSSRSRLRVRLRSRSRLRRTMSVTKRSWAVA